MKILHLCLSCFYIDNYSYQENILPEIHQKDNNDVLIIASTETYIDNKNLGYTNAGCTFTKSGIPIIRLDYKSIFPKKIMTKVRIYKDLISQIQKFNPDIILYHGIGGMAILDVIKYKKKYNKNVKIYVDSHEDFNNSGKNWISKNILHKCFNRRIIQSVLSDIEKILYISSETKTFVKNCYNIPEEKLEFYPLGGLILTEEERNKKRIKIRNLLNIDNDDILFIHSGKMNKEKKTLELLKQFLQIKDSKFRLILIGSINQEIESFFKTIEDKRIKFLGWKNNEELIDYLCAGDVYLQPGSQSATMQNAMCNENTIVLFPHKSHEPYLKENGYFVKDEKEIYEVLKNISENKNQLEKMKKESLKIAINILDYKKLARRIYNEI